MNPRTGISCSRAILILLLFTLVARPVFARKVTGNDRELKPLSGATERAYEIQSHQTALENRFDFDMMQAVGISRVIVRVFQDEAKHGGLFFSNPYFRVIRPMLDALSSEFAQQPLQLSAWMITRNYKWLEDERFFDRALVDGTSRPVPRLDLFNPDTVNRILAVFQALAIKPIDAILIQDDFFIRHNEGFSSWGKAYFAQHSGTSPDVGRMVVKGDPFNRLWRDIKTERIIAVLHKLIAAVKTVNPAIDLGMNVHYETPFFPDRARAWYAHDLKELVATGIDSIYLMAYHRQIKDEMKLSESKNRELFAKILTEAARLCGEKLVVKLQVRDWSTGDRIPITELNAYLRLVPPTVRRICFTPVIPEDISLIGHLIEMDRARAVPIRDRQGSERR